MAVVFNQANTIRSDGRKEMYEAVYKVQSSFAVSAPRGLTTWLWLWRLVTLTASFKISLI